MLKELSVFILKMLAGLILSWLLGADADDTF